MDTNRVTFRAELLPNGFVRVDDRKSGLTHLWERGAHGPQIRSGNGRSFAGELDKVSELRGY